ncbi:hypothetical protein HK099_000151 [Clydaea vesicula]|uniref:Uncharacterized protein n=1 Tax=Clydaea vesicula TaxID=447962 RepID=A0AAD5U7M0_9FUNG|nr:hypothetical protein HK099_000151 [Clydaea vesicula]
MGEPIDLNIVELPNHVLKFEDGEWENYSNSLKPLGLNILLNSDCSTLQDNKKKIEDNHRRFCNINIHGKVHTYQQSCLCNLSREIGFSDDVLKNFIFRKSVQTFSPFSSALTIEKNFDIPNMFTRFFEERGKETEGKFHMMTDGEVGLVLQCCSEFWNGKELGILTDEVKKKIMEFYEKAISADRYVVAYSYGSTENYYSNIKANNSINLISSVEDLNRPNYLVLGDQSNIMKDKFNENSILSQQSFLGLIVFEYNPKENVRDFIEDLELAGIRFVYFSSLKYRESKAYAERLGLEIDWNACILLSSVGGYSEEHDIRARLPQGVENIRSHLENVDDIPLHVSLFAECTPFSVREMIKIFQDNGEVVCVIGSSMNLENVECFSLADIAVAVDPVFGSRRWKYNLQMNVLSAGATFNTIPCALNLHCDTNIYCLTQLVREARTLAENSKQVVNSLVHA